MRKVILLLGLVLQVIIVDAQSVSGSLVDEKGNPVSFANVVLLSSKDSSFVQGTISNEQGIFSIDQTSGNNILRISCLGFIPMTKAYAQFPVTIVMHEDVNLLGEVVVKGNRPSYKLTAEGLQTHVQGTVLSKMGTAEDVLKHIPGLQKKNDAYEVFGKGSPIIYVNGRLLRDLSELDQLKSEDIKNVELITSPGARYDASVKAAIRKIGLSLLPGLQKKNDAYEVFGKGSPIIYVNGRLLRDLSELDQLKSEDIKNVELITSPGARYDASVKAAIRKIGLSLLPIH